MSWKSIRSIILLFIICILSFSLIPVPTARGAGTIFASPVQAGCYQVKLSQCKIHVEPFTINLTPGTKLVYFQLLATRVRTGVPQVIYDFHPDISNPVPFSGNTYTPSQVAKDFAATCGETYYINLEGQDTGDPNPYNLGTTGQFSCTPGFYSITLPLVRK
jgi:hypothetical protein